MRWIRRHIRSGAWLAVTALALHMVLTFGHVHAEELYPASMIVGSVATIDVQAADYAADPLVDEVAGQPVDDGDRASEQRYRTLRAHHFCAICANISLLGTSVPPVAQTLALPRADIDIHKADIPAATPPRELRSASRARAPPSA
jgi:hypothetical protein